MEMTDNEDVTHQERIYPSYKGHHMNLIVPDHILLAYIVAELSFLLIRTNDIIIIAKSDSQRTPQESTRAKRGITRSLILEILLFVPASTTILLLISPQIVVDMLIKISGSLAKAYSLLGLISYGFPFSTVRAIVTRLAANFIREFSAIIDNTKNETTSQH